MYNKHILLIDDDDSICTLVRIIIEVETNWKISIAYSGKEGIQKAINNDPDIILLDINMPDMNGIETLKNLKSNVKTQSIPVIFFTSETKILKKPQNRKLNVKGLLTKPIEIETFKNKLEGIINS